MQIFGVAKYINLAVLYLLTTLKMFVITREHPQRFICKKRFRMQLKNFIFSKMAANSYIYIDIATVASYIG